MKYSGKVFAYFEPRRKNFLISTYNEEKKWTSYHIDNMDEMENIKTRIKYYIDQIK